MKKSELFFTGVLVPLDMGMIFLSGILAYYMRFTSWANKIIGPVIFNLSIERYLIIILIISFVCPVIFAFSGLYRIRPKRSWPEEVLRILIACSAGIGIIMAFIVLRGQMFESRFIILAGWVLAMICVIFGRSFLRIMQKWLMSHYNFAVNNIVLIGKNNVVKKISLFIRQHPSLGYRIIDFMLEFNFEKIKKLKNLHEIICIDSDLSEDQRMILINFSQEHRIVLKFVPSMTQAMVCSLDLEMFGRFPVLEIKKTPLDGWGAIFKIWIDIIGAVLGLIILSPVFLIISLIIKWDSGGPVFVKLTRVSKGREFKVYKFRSMIDRAWEHKKGLAKHNERHDGPLFKMQNDPRITRFGRILRKTRFDEFAQLLNVLKGEMSLIGPRPHEPGEIAKYAKHHKKLLTIKPGMSGMAQISGGHKLSFEEEVRLDTYYIENWNPFLDLEIFLKTLVLLVRDRSGC
tara:strand:- start:2055 stop:3431 length:1377 start_codon:yes stop_codon:yes gene_type:complete